MGSDVFDPQIVADQIIEAVEQLRAELAAAQGPAEPVPSLRERLAAAEGPGALEEVPQEPAEAGPDAKLDAALARGLADRRKAERLRGRVESPTDRCSECGALRWGTKRDVGCWGDGPHAFDGTGKTTDDEGGR